MTTKEFRECLMDVYQGEVTGEVAFESMLRKAESPEQTYVLGTVLQFETEGKAMLRPLLARFGLPMVDDAEAKAAAGEASSQMNAAPWKERFAALSEIVKTSYLPRYTELATLVSTDEDAEAARIAIFMGDHERALVALADNVAAEVDDPAAPVAKLLNFPLPRNT